MTNISMNPKASIVVLESLIVALKEKINNINQFLSFDKDEFYEQEKDSISSLEKRYKKFEKDYKVELKNIIKQLKSRLNSISAPIPFKDCFDYSSNLTKIIEEYNEIIKQTNQKTSKLSKTQSEARLKLRLHEIKVFLKTIKYTDKKRLIDRLDKDREKGQLNLPKTFG